VGSLDDEVEGSGVACGVFDPQAERMIDPLANPAISKNSRRLIRLFVMTLPPYKFSE
jgi:hypothetical protein